MATGATVPGLYSHIAHSVDKEEGDIPQPFKGTKPKQTRGRGKPQDQRQNPPKAQEVEENYNYESPNNYYHNTSKSMEHKQIHDYYEAQRHIQSTMEGDTPTKTSQNTQCIDNIRDYDR